MPDLTIKPVGAAGNKLILQDQAGAAVLTTADSGAAIESNVTNNAGVATGTIASAVTFPAGHIIKTQTTFLPIQDQASTAGTAYVNYWSPTYTPIKNNSIVYAWLHIMGMHQHNGNWQPVWTHKYSITGANITNLTNVDEFTRGWENPTSTNMATWMEIQHMNLLRPVTLDGNGTGTITYALYFKNNNSAWYSHTLRIYGYTSGTDTKGSSITFQEVAP